MGRKRAPRQHTPAHRASQQWDHVSSRAFLLDWTDDGGTSGLNHGQIVLRCNRHFVAAPPRISRIPIMKSRSALAAVMLMASVPARADPPKVAVFDLELVDTRLQGEVDGPRTDEQRRLMRTGDQLALAESGKFAVLDIAPVIAAAHASNLQSCGGCAADLPQQLGAGFS